MSAKPSPLAASLILVALLNAIVLLGSHPRETRAQAQPAAIAREFSLPLGYRDGVAYGPRIRYDNGRLVENSDYGIFNPDMQGATCFGLDWGSIYHAGVDWYRLDGQSTWQAEVTAVGDGLVRYLSYNFPGAVMLVEHSLPPDGRQKIYSLYGHLDPNSVLVSVNQQVSRGQKLGAILRQYYDGRYTDYHDDSHLHFEMRSFYDASSIYPNYPSCNGYLPGRGYTHPQHPDLFPSAQSEHYTHPIAYIQTRTVAFLPLMINQDAACIEQQQLVVNGGFEGGSLGWVEIQQGYPIITNSPPTPAYSGSWAAWFGGRNSAAERIYQGFRVTPGMTGANLSYYLWMRTDEASTGAYDKLYVRLRDGDDGLIQQLDYLDNQASEHTWLHRSAALPDLSARVGQTLRLSFEASTDGTLVTSFLLDQVSLGTVCAGEQP